MKKSPVKLNSQFAAGRVTDLDELELDIDLDKIEEDEPEFVYGLPKKTLTALSWMTTSIALKTWN